MKAVDRASALLELLRSVLSFVGCVRWQVLVTLFAFVTFARPSQIHEVYRIYTEHREISPHAVTLIVGLALLAFTIRNNLLLGLGQAKAVVTGRLVRILSTILAVAPMIGAVIGVGAAMPEVAADHDLVFRLHVLRAVLAGQTALLAAIFLLLQLKGSTEETDFRFRIRRILSVFALVLSLPMFFLVTTIVATFGTILIAIIFFLLLSCILSLLTSLSLVLRLPLIGLAIFFAAVFSAFDLNNNHDIRLVQTNAKPWDAQKGFGTWLENRADRLAYESVGRRYPVFIVLAEGGGIYAANHAALFLARMQDICPNFSQHIFLISAVSGGSLGAGIFAGVAQEHVRNTEVAPCLPTWEQPGEVEKLARHAVNHDFLAPLVGAALFPDLLQYLLPFSVAKFDRAKVAEASFESIWDSLSQYNNPMLQDFLSLWTPEGATPALLLNVTRVETGGRSEISHIELGDGFYSNGLILNQKTGEVLYSVRLSTAIGLSSRFPFVTPAGRLNPPLPFNVVSFGTDNFVDGGYYDNSGADAVLDLLQQISHIPEYEKVDLRVIILKSLASSENYAYGFDVLMPIRTIVNSRAQRARSAEDRLIQALCLTHDNCDQVAPNDQKVWFSYLDEEGYELPLGWLFSRESTEAVSQIIGRPQDCSPDMYERGCTILQVTKLLQPASDPALAAPKASAAGLDSPASAASAADR